jgi:hypothetical protein
VVPAMGSTSDLIAQQEMAWWAFWMFVATAAQFVIGIATLVFLALAFGQARKTAEAGIAAANAAVEGNQLSRDFFVTEQRPWIPVTVEFLQPSREQRRSPLTCHANGATLRLTIKFKNTGKLPAEGVRYHWEARANAVKARADLARVAESQKQRQWNPEDGPGDLLFAGQEQIFEPKLTVPLAQLEREAVNGEYSLAILACVTYQSSIVSGRLQTVFFSEVQRKIKRQPRTFSVNDMVSLSPRKCGSGERP